MLYEYAIALLPVVSFLAVYAFIVFSLRKKFAPHYTAFLKLGRKLLQEPELPATHRFVIKWKIVTSLFAPFAMVLEALLFPLFALLVLPFSRTARQAVLDPAAGISQPDIAREYMRFRSLYGICLMSSELVSALVFVLEIALFVLVLVTFGGGKTIRMDGLKARFNSFFETLTMRKFPAEA